MRTLGTALVLAAMAASPAMAQEQTRGTILSISGSGLAVVEPDMATITLGVRNFGPSAVSVTNENARRMISLRDALRRAGVEERDIQTSAISVSPRYRRVGDNYRVPDGYDASNSVRARVREIDDVGAVLDAAIAAGGNDVDGVRFGLQDPEAALDSARMDALTDARERAADYAETLGMRVARVISVTEAGARTPVFSGDDEIVVTASRREGGEPTPIAAGELETRTSLNVVFELR